MKEKEAFWGCDDAYLTIPCQETRIEKEVSVEV
jgi:hypothetical protein